MTAFAINGIATIDGVPTNGLVCVAYLASRFLGTPPVLGSRQLAWNTADF